VFAVLSVEAMLPTDAGLRVRAPTEGSVTITDASGRENAATPGFFQDPDGTVGVTKAADGPYKVTVKDGSSAEVASDVGGTVIVWREVNLARGGGSFVADVAPLLGPASLVVGAVSPAIAEASSIDAAGGAAIAITVVVVALAIWALRTRRR
jgi:hypothetical protein